MTVVSELSSSALEAQLHSSFAFVVPGVEGTIEMELTEHRRGSFSPATEQFAIVFSGPAQPLVPQGTYSVAHDELGTFELFIVPIGRDADHVRYEAVFNLLVHPPAVSADAPTAGKG